jgi:hypothetical protein
MLNNRNPAGASNRRHVLMLVGAAGAAASILPGGWTAFAAEAHNKAAATHVAAKQKPHSAKTSETAAALRDLWIGHIFWVRSVSLAAIEENDAAIKTAEQQVVANAQAIAASIEPFYGVAAKEAFFKLLAGHYGAVKSYLVATVGNDSSGQGAATKSLTSNAEAIAVFLSKANPNLPKEALQSLLLAHGGHHIQQIQDLKSRNYVAEAKIWESMKVHVYQIADATADALAKQFPKRF